MLRNVKILDKDGVMYLGVHRKEGDVIAVADTVAARFAESGKGEILPLGPRVEPTEDNPYAAAVDPLVENADPLHSARNLGLAVEDHPGLVALADAGHPGAPRRTGRVVPGEVSTTTSTDGKPAKAK